MHSTTFLLYGANGYSGELIARFAQQHGLTPILAGRRKEAVESLANRLNLSFRIFDLNDQETLQVVLKEVNVVIHAAGPFQYTARQMVEACIQTGTHYLDINGDIAVFEMIKKYDQAAENAGVMLMPGVGFDVVPTDCIALHLKNKMPEAVSLQLAFATLGGGISHGTATTMAGKLGEGGAVRKEGKIIRKPLGQKGMWVDFGKKKLFVMSIPWGDISTAFFTTGIPDIETFTGISKKVYWFLKGQFLYNWLLRTTFFRKYLKKKINQQPAGPSDEQRNKAISLVWGKAATADGRTVVARLSGPEGYTLTAQSALIIAKKVLSNNFKTGYQTPAKVYGEDLILEIPGVKREIDV